MEEKEPSRRSIRHHVKKYFQKNRQRFAGKEIVDFPAGNGYSSEILRDIGAKPLPFDLFPEYFLIDGLKCERANINENIPLKDNSVDGLLCQEGIEHFSDQYQAFKEFGRIIKKGGSLIITTPNYSSLRAKMSYLLTESERYHKIISWNELDSIWMNRQDITDEYYFGHIFLTGIQKIRVLAKLNGFKIKHIQPTIKRNANIFWFPFLYPFILLSNLITYGNAMRKNKSVDKKIKKEVYKEIFRLNTNPTVLLDGHLFIELEKEANAGDVAKRIKSIQMEFGAM
ncbi:MAG: class I SAM-dependent methyltransferase [Bacteroidota bacterium]